MGDIRTTWEELGVNLELHDELLQNLNRLHQKTHLSQANRPETMHLFDRSFHESHAGRVVEIMKYRNKGGKSIGTFCIYVPEEIAMAADVLAIPLCGGSGWSVSYADQKLPRDICPVIRSTFGMSLSATCPYKKLKDAAVGETTCDAKKKAWDLFGFDVMEVPQRKEDVDRKLWRREVWKFKAQVENLSGVKITPERLRETIRLFNRKRSVLQKINAFRALPNPPISGLDALLVSQVALNQDTEAFIKDAERLIDELQQRVANEISAYRDEGPRVMMAGSPSPMGNAKVHYLVESAGMHVVVDESCTGIRYYRNLVDDSATDLEGMMTAIADRYFDIDCSCFSPNTERLDNIASLVDEYNVQGVVQNILQYCLAYNVEAKAVEKMLKEKDTPSITIVTDYSEEDTGQILTRLEAFSEMVKEVV